jgi:hypothetical protein
LQFAPQSPAHEAVLWQSSEQLFAQVRLQSLVSWHEDTHWLPQAELHE